MRKYSLMILLLLLTACETSQYPGEKVLYCESKDQEDYYYFQTKEVISDDQVIVTEINDSYTYDLTSTFYSKDDFIYQSTWSKTIIKKENPELIDFYHELPLKQFLRSIAVSYEGKPENINIQEDDEKLVLSYTSNIEARKSGWKGLILPKEKTLQHAIDSLDSIKIQCELTP